MSTNNFKILAPRQGNCLFVSGQMVYSKEFPLEGKDYHESSKVAKLGDRTGRTISQTINENSKGFIKENTIKSYGKPVYKNIQKLDKDGFYSSTRLIDDKIIESYSVAPKKTAKLTGFKGFVEKVLWNIANKSNGCERPFFNKIAGKAINKLRQVK